jgi:hypothetical protein
MTVSTYGTPATNLPWPTAAPYGVTNLNSSTNLSPDNRDATADRFWYVGFTSPNVTNDSIVLTYASPSELPAAPFNIPDSIRGQFWDAANGSWALPVVGYDSTNVLNAIIIPNPSLNRVWSLVSNISPMGPLPLPIELVDFKGKYINNQSVLSWVTASENVKHAFRIGLKNSKTISKVVIDLDTGFIYDSSSHASKSSLYSTRHLNDMLNGVYANKTNLQYYKPTK